MERFGKRLVIPGDELAVIEEFSSSENTYVHDGRVIAKVVGLSRFDFEERKAGIDPIKRPPLPRAGSVVYGWVVKVRDPVATLEVFYVEDYEKYLHPPMSGVLHAMNVSSSYVKTLYDVLGYGDVVRAKVLVNRIPPYVLSIRGREFGVVFSRCPHCMSPLRKRGLSLFCGNCKRTVKRKISPAHYLLK